MALGLGMWFFFIIIIWQQHIPSWFFFFSLLLHGFLANNDALYLRVFTWFLVTYFSIARPLN